MNIYNDYQEIIFRILFSILAGVVVGLERKSKGKPVGLITNTMVCFGATMLSIYQQITVLGVQHYGFTLAYHELTSNGSRIVAQIVSGIGFLGAGTIIRDNNKVSGITTAAVLWFMACFGIIIGAGYWFLSFACLITVVFVLYVMKELDRRVIDHSQMATIIMTCDGSVNVVQIFEEYDIKIRRYVVTKVHKNDDGHWIRSIVIKTSAPPYINLKKMIGEVSQKEGVLSCTFRK